MPASHQECFEAGGALRVAGTIFMCLLSELYMHNYMHNYEASPAAERGRLVLSRRLLRNLPLLWLSSPRLLMIILASTRVHVRLLLQSISCTNMQSLVTHNFGEGGASGADLVLPRCSPNCMCLSGVRHEMLHLLQSRRHSPVRL